jgi:serine/alanine racemase
MKPISFHKSRSWIELDMDNLRHNVNKLRSILPNGCELMPAVKANAYGHGAIAICRELNKLGVRAFCVASVMEGVELRKRHVKGDILILGYTHPEQFYLLKRYRLIQTVIDCEYAKTLNNYGKKIVVHVKIDTGLKRLGEPSGNIENILQIFKHEHLAIAGIYTHFSAQNNDFTQIQIENFSSVLSIIQKHGLSIPKTHSQSSYGVFSRPDLVFDYARIGIALYGAYKDIHSTVNNTEFRPVLSVKARISTIKNALAGEAVGYGSAFIAPNDMKIAVLSVGYADGIPHLLSCGVGNVLINGLAAPIVGYVCMDQLTVDITNIQDVKQGDIATIIGKDGEKEITALDLAKQTGTVPNEILSRLGNRLERYKTGIIWGN